MVPLSSHIRSVRWYRTPLFALAACSVAFFVMSLRIAFHAPLFSDDLYYLNWMNRDGYSLTSFLYERYTTWSARVISDAYTMFALQLPAGGWRVTVAIFFALVYAGLVRVVVGPLHRRSAGDVLWVSLFAGGALWFVFEGVLASAVFWLSGAASYVLPVSALLLAGVFLRNVVAGEKIRWRYGYVIPVMVAANQEQTALLLIMAFAAVLLWMRMNHRPIEKNLVFLTFMGGLVAAVTFLCPGNINRYAAEVRHWYPAFSELDAGDKLLRGWRYVMRHAYALDHSVVWLVYGIIGLGVWMRRVHIGWRLATIFPLMVLLCVHIDPDSIWGTIAEKKTVAHEYGPWLWLTLASAVEGACLFSLFKDRARALVVTGIFVAAFGISWAVSFSPTIYDSGERVFFVGNILFILVATCVFDELRAAGVKQGDTQHEPITPITPCASCRFSYAWGVYVLPLVSMCVLAVGTHIYLRVHVRAMKKHQRRIARELREERSAGAEILIPKMLRKYQFSSFEENGCSSWVMRSLEAEPQAFLVSTNWSDKAEVTFSGHKPDDVIIEAKSMTSAFMFMSKPMFGEAELCEPCMWGVKFFLVSTSAKPVSCVESPLFACDLRKAGGVNWEHVPGENPLALEVVGDDSGNDGGRGTPATVMSQVEPKISMNVICKPTLCHAVVSMWISAEGRDGSVVYWNGNAWTVEPAPCRLVMEVDGHIPLLVSQPSAPVVVWKVQLADPVLMSAGPYALPRVLYAATFSEETGGE